MENDCTCKPKRLVRTPDGTWVCPQCGKEWRAKTSDEAIDDIAFAAAIERAYMGDFGSDDSG